MKLNFQRIFDGPLSRLSHFQKELLGCKGYFDYISSYLLNLEYSQWVNTSTPEPKLPGLNPTDVQGWTLGINLISRLSSLLLINIK